MKKTIIFSIILTSSIFGAKYDIEELKQKPNSLAKDYYIYKSIDKQNITQEEADELKQHIYRYVGKIQKLIEQISPTIKDNNFGYIVKKNPTCFGYTYKNILEYSTECQRLIIDNDFETLSKIDKEARVLLLDTFKEDQNISDTLNALNADNPMDYLANKNAYVFLRFYANGRTNFTDFHANKSFILDLKSSKNYDSFIDANIRNKRYPKLRSTLIATDTKDLKPQTAFYLGINALDFNKPKEAMKFFQTAYDGYDNLESKDNSLFWIYYLTKNKKQKQELLTKLASSKSINIYSIYAKELLKMPLPNYNNGIIKPKPTKQKLENFDIKDPFAWQDLSVQIAKLRHDKVALSNLAQQYFTKETLPHFSYIDSIASGYKNQYFLMPYNEYLQGDNKRKALILAIARQESRFIPAAISTSYALGMMQFMPFLADHVGKELLKIKDFDADLMFDPKVAYEFANIHIDYLKKHLNSPVFIAYAYNGGLGFTKRMLSRDDMFKKGKYEPFLSMEFVPYVESKIYAKKVLANYIIYSNLLGEKIKISKVFADLNSQTDQNLVKSQ